MNLHISSHESKKVKKIFILFITVFVYTCCDARAFEYDVIKSICEVTWKLFESSRLHVRGKFELFFENSLY